MQSRDTTDAPIVPYIATDTAETGPTAEDVASDGGRPAGRPFDRPPRTDHAAEYTRDVEEIEPFVADLR